MVPTSNSRRPSKNWLRSIENAAGTTTYTTVDGNRSTDLTAHTETYVSSTTIPVGDYTLNGTFYSQAGESGIVVATVTVPVAVSPTGMLTKPDGSALGEVAFDGVVKSVKVAPNQTAGVGAQQQLVVTAYDANSNALVLTPGSFDFPVVTGSSNLSVTPVGIATGVATGPATVTASVDGLTSPAATVSVTSVAQAFRFTNNTDSIQLTGGALNGACTLGTAFTVEAWVRPTSGSGNIWQQWTNGSMDQRFGFANSALQVVTDDNFDNSTSTLPANQWSHVAWCYDGTNMQLYQNGTLVLNMALSSDQTGATVGEACALGYNNSELAAGSNAGFQGDLAGFRISNTNRYTGNSYTPPSLPLTLDGSTLMLIDPYSSATTPNTLTAPGLQGIIATLGAGGGSATSPTWVAYTP